jgi:hypothetical protein
LELDRVTFSSTKAHNPKASAGYFAWDAGITRMRQMFCRDGWNALDESGVELIVNHEFRLKVTVMNADKGVCDPLRSPQSHRDGSDGGENYGPEQST